ncbi:metallophosphoesterase [Criblamydia sequanensis]|uniref:Metallophosphoesterase n=1 Tax=Candidatus Criblamydia sequanensis CRIB-18 TaxID=1437425 RepID=A0A090CZB2_9BACT|nr:metallophosphoesterase [Criblamydia sequanensis]CDR34322.1 Putative metallophosphoesterase [Criblamydia sequanensis CRIB-18]
MPVFALADLHLSFGVPNKKMDIFGERWKNHSEQIAENWLSIVGKDDLILLPGDISWAKEPKDAVLDLKFIDSLPGTKVMIKGNHDYWWSSLKKLETLLPPSIHLIQNTAFNWKDISVAGSRLWDTYEFNFDGCIDYTPNDALSHLMAKEEDKDQDEKIFLREMQRLETSLKQLSSKAKHRIAMTHYPPIGVDLKASRVSLLLEKYKVETCVFGHIHSMKENLNPFFGEKNGVRYLFAAGDFIHFKPILVLP